MLARYAWNMGLGSALYPLLQLLEVALRNALHRALTQHHGGDERWYELPQAFPWDDTWSRRSVLDATQKVTKVTTLNAADAPGRVVASLNFGFWTSLLTSRYGSPASARRHWSPPWPTLLPLVFPAFPRPTGTSRDREAIAERFDDIRQLRNRISHHEPIWKGRPIQRTAQRVPIQDQHDEILDAIGWISGDLKGAATLLSTFPSIHTGNVAPYRAALAALP